jgi:hypothetical protein
MHSMKNLFIITVQTSRNSEIIKIRFFPNIPQFAYPIYPQMGDMQIGGYWEDRKTQKNYAKITNFKDYDE